MYFGRMFVLSIGVGNNATKGTFVTSKYTKNCLHLQGRRPRSYWRGSNTALDLSAASRNRGAAWGWEEEETALPSIKLWTQSHHHHLSAYTDLITAPRYRSS